MNQKELYHYLKGQLIVSCQALEGEPLYRPEGGIMDLMAKAAIESGAKAIRAQGMVDIAQIKQATDVPVIGIIKKSYPGYEGYITMTMAEIDALVATKADIIALDATNRRRGDGLSAYEFIQKIREKYPNIVLMGDVSTVEEGLLAEEAGCAFIGTTLSGYTAYTQEKTGPDFELIEQLAQKLTVPLIAEGKIHYPKQAAQALKAGAHCVVVGGAITRPQEITSRFMNAIKEVQ